MTSHNSFNILDHLRNRFLLVELKGHAGIRASVNYVQGKDLIRASKGGDESAYSVSQRLYPKGYDGAKNGLTKAYNAVRSHFYANTLAFQHSASGTAAGKRLVPNDSALRGEFIAEHTRLVGILDNYRENFAQLIPHTVQRIEDDGALGSDFDRDNYPTPDQVRASYHYEPLTPLPIAGNETLGGLPVSADVAASMSQTMQAQSEADYQFGVQAQARETLEYLQTMAGNLSRLVDWHNTDESSRSTRQPAIYDSLFANVEHAVSKLRAFAVPETDEGARMIEVADTIEANLLSERTDAEALRTNLPMAQEHAEKAAAAAQAIEEIGLAA